ncbi:ATP-binding protein [Paraburkholderia bryophila]|uniref:Uncharacterized protein n=1 Tax=Paraburkholderia bryophila TaxID=420952 RepID=A0A7Y9WJF9_9BURK|nr:ATP-binding protein [Paraburkholderia bryophila]NYH21388.1 hypothetical protein [Paraburkholderia bryophila]
MTTSNQLRDIAVQALISTTDAAANVFSPRDQPSWDGEYPVLFVTVDDEDGQSFGRSGSPAFTVTATLRVEARAESPGAASDAGAAALRVQLETLRDQIKAAVINYSGLMPLLQQFPFFRTRFVPGPPEAEQHVGSAVVEIGMEFVQGPEAFYQASGTPLQGIDVTVVEPEGTTEPYFSIDLPQSIS